MMKMHSTFKKPFIKFGHRLGGWLWRVGCHPCSHQTLRWLLAVGVMGICLSALGDGSDILQGTDAALWATLNGTGKKYIYAAEGILGLAAYMKTKNLLVLSGIVVVSIFFNIILSIAGESA